MPDDRASALEELHRTILSSPAEQTVTVQRPHGIAVVKIPSERRLYTEGIPGGTGESLPPKTSTNRGPLDLTDSEREVAGVLLTLGRGLGYAAKEVASRLKMDLEPIAKRLRRMRRRGLVERIAGIGFRLTAAGRAAIASDQATGQTGQVKD